ncbi:Hsp70 family protein [Tahibacter sp. UC22_41]|uniref:Hsp70 family protein n=1 Tax=Tahibacter sp. UC22_41 TaxID=3350178 RepID=UPI0036DEF5CC
MIVGIDLGTTHSLVGLWTDDGARLIPNALGELLTPSVVGATDDGRLLVGRAALEQLPLQPERTVAAFKRHMGSDRTSVLAGRRLRCEELSALVLRSLLDDVRAHTGAEVSEAVISVPAYFSDAQRKATRNAAQIAGIRVERLVNEPTAAALAYGLQERGGEAKFLVLDIGGGTFDVSLLDSFDGVMEVHASAGDNFLGGEDFVDILVQAALQDLQVASASLTPRARAALRARIERVKCQLSHQADISTVLPIGEDVREWSISEQRFESLSAPLLARLRAPIERAMRDSGTRPQDLDQIVLVGGASRMPMISRLVTRLFGRLPLRHIHPDQTVALGACALAGMKARDVAFREIVMTDVCPYTLGVEVSHTDEHARVHDGLFSPLIERNSVIPTSRVSTYYPSRDFQEALRLRVFQGESPEVAHNIFLGELLLPLQRRRSADNPLEVRFTYDINGLLEIQARLAADGIEKQLVIEQNPGLLTPQQISERLAALATLKIHPREQQANLALLARAARLYEECTGAARQEIGNRLVGFKSALEAQESRQIETARRHLSNLLDYVDGDASPLPP